MSVSVSFWKSRRKGQSEMEIYTTRYQANKIRKTDPYHRSDEKIVKVSGGYSLMNSRDYEIWKKQK